MFCHQCGKELRENACFCTNCGAPVREVSDQAAVSSDNTNDTAPQTAASSDDRKNPGMQEIPAQSTVPDTETPANLILKRGKVIITDRELHLNRKDYARKPGKKIFLSLLLLTSFFAGAFFSARYGYDTYNELNTPYRDNGLAAQENIMAIIDNDGASQLLRFQNGQKENLAATATLLEKLDGLKEQQTQEILEIICASDQFDLDTFFNRNLFSSAYQEYLQDLLDAFKADESLHSWLHSYYETARAYGGNHFISTDMWIYSSDGENLFSADLDSAASLMNEQYDLDLYEHILYTGRIYITGADFLRKILALPRYTVDGAVFVKVWGGTPDTAEMSVPGWSRSHYEEFWLYGADYYSISTPMWLDCGFQAENFELDWNALVDEASYYTAYRNFIDKIDPNLPCYDIAVYHADDMAYGGMGCSLKGEEASFSDLVASYTKKHPEFIDELMESGISGQSLTTSADIEISETEARLAKLESELLDLQSQEKELAQILADADIHRSHYGLLQADIKQHTQKLTYRLLFFAGAALLCALAALICLCNLCQSCLLTNET